MTDQIQELYLRPWQEIIGKCIQTTTTKIETIITLQTKGKKYRLHLPCTQEKPETLQGRYIAILKTDDLENPFLIRKLDNINVTTTTTSLVNTTTASETTIISKEETT